MNKFKKINHDIQSKEFIINIGPQHPSTHGVLKLQLSLEGEIITRCIPHIGYLHRCFEKHAENITYKQIIPYTDRLDYLSSMINNHIFCIGVEKMLNISNNIPIRIEYIRVLVCELNRIASHLMFIGTYSMDLGSITPFLWAFIERENIIKLLEWVSGSRMLYNYITIGGIHNELPDDFEKYCKEAIQNLKYKIKSFNKMLTNNILFINRTANVGILPMQMAINYGCTGPVLRGSGLKWDLRKVDQYSIYNKLNFQVAYGKGLMGTTGDCWDRFKVRVEEIESSINIILECIEYLINTPKINIKYNNKKIHIINKEYYIRGEGSKGELGFYFIAQETNNEKPYRCKVRAPSFSNLQVISELAKGALISDLIAILGSIDIILGEVDR